jgi:hypothetical protein
VSAVQLAAVGGERSRIGNNGGSEQGVSDICAAITPMNREREPSLVEIDVIEPEELVGLNKRGRMHSIAHGIAATSTLPEVPD